MERKSGGILVLNSLPMRERVMQSNTVSTSHSESQILLTTGSRSSPAIARVKGLRRYTCLMAAALCSVEGTGPSSLKVLSLKLLCYLAIC